MKLVSDQEPTEMRKLLTALKEDLEVHIEFNILQAQLLKVKYDALVEEGFTAEQALELCKT